MNKPSKRDWEFITAVCDDLVADLGLEPDGHRTWAKTTDEIIKEVESELKEKLPSLIAHIREEAVEERDKEWISIISDIAKEFPTQRLFAQWLSLEVESRLKKLLSTLKPKESL